MRVAVVGCGYVGLVSGVGLAAWGHEVVGIEVDPARMQRIASGRAPFHEPGLDELLSRTLEDGTFRVTAGAEAAGDADVVFLAVQTPPAPDGSNDTRFLREAAEALAEVFTRHPDRDRVVAIRSTVVPGTAENVVAPALADLGDRVAVASNPEFLREGSAVADYLSPDRVVVGVRETWAADLLERLYARAAAPVVITTPATAELVKYTSNALLATLVSFSNEIARLCERTPDVDVEDVLGAIHLDRRLRVGHGEGDGRGGHPASITSYLKAGCGFGGSCLPKDLSALIHYGEQVGHPPRLLEAVRGINESQPVAVVDLADEALGGLSGRRVGVLGLAFKGGTDDVRESPGLRIVDLLRDRGAEVVLLDPLVDTSTMVRADPPRVTAAESLIDVFGQVDACIVASDDPGFGRLVDLAGDANGSRPVIVDGRRTLDPDRLDDGRFVAVGRSSPRALTLASEQG